MRSHLGKEVKISRLYVRNGLILTSLISYKTSIIVIKRRKTKKNTDEQNKLTDCGFWLTFWDA